MKPHHDFTAERALAQHCPELLAPPREQEDKGDIAKHFAESLCEALPGQLQPLLVGRRPQVSAGEPVTQTAASLLREIGRPSASYMVEPAGPGAPLLVSFDLSTAASLTDRLFGGDGKLGDETPNALPLSSSLALERVVAAIAVATGEPGDSAPIITRDNDVARLAPFPRGEYCMSWELAVAQDGLDDWSVRIATLESALAGPSGANNAQGGPANTAPIGQRAQAGPFEAVPLELTAVLAEMKLPIARIAALAAGDVLPLAPRREIPLRIGPETLAYGSIGTLDESVALQLTRIS